MSKFKKDDLVTYAAGENRVRAMVRQVHRDGSYTVQARHYLNEDGSSRPGFLGFTYRLNEADLSAAS